MSVISVIIPLYNASKYLSESLQSVLGQTYEDFELICVDDCSTDDTGKILRDFQKMDGRIRILTNGERLGAAGARNRGLKEAQGKYVIFLDGDDVFEEEMLDKAYNAMEKYDADMVIFEYMHVPSDEIYIKRKAEHPEPFREQYCKHPFSVKDFPPEGFPNWSDSVCDKMFKRKFIYDNSIEFQNLPSYNDVYFSKMAFYCAEKIIWLDDDQIMVYARDHYELSRISSDRDPMCAYYAMEKLAVELKKRNMMADLAAYYYYRMLIMMLCVLKKEKKDKRKQKFYNFLHDEGIARLINYGKESYGKINIYDQYLLESFQNNTYESEWFNVPDIYYQNYLRKKSKKICRFITDKLVKGNTVIIWGIGINGTKLLRYLNTHNIKISAAVDADKNKQGSFVEGYEVLNPAAFLDKTDYIITTSDYVYHAVENQLRGTNVVVINAFDLLVKEEYET